MKKLSKILSVVLAVSMIFSTVAFAADFSDVNSENNYYEPIKILSAFGIINGYEDGTFGPDKDVTRAEFAKMLLGAMASAGIGDTDPAKTPFTDLHDPTVAWAVGDIKTAYDLGIINGMTETTFEPKANVTYEQALKMIVCALNYGGQAEVTQASVPGQPWYYGYLQTARNLGLTDKVTVLEGQPAKRAHIAQMVYNALEVNMLEKVQIQGGGDMYMQSNQNWLKDKLKITKARGTLLADETNTMDENGATAKIGYALFSGEDGKNVTIAKNNISLDGLLGKTVEYYYKTDVDGNNELVLAFNKSGSNPSIKVSAANLNSVKGSYGSGFVVDYYESDTAVKTSKLEVSANPIVSINGEVYTNVTANDLTIESGSLEFISDGGVYNKISVEKFDTYVVKSVNKTDKYIVDMYKSTSSNLYIDEEDSNFEIAMKNSSGSSVSISNLAQYNVLTVKKSKGTSNRTNLDITVSTKNVSGNIQEIDDDYININGTVYKISAYLRNNGGQDVAKLSVGDSCKAYLDVDGSIAYIEKTASSSTYYGYIADASADDDDVKITLISQKTTSMGTYVRTATKVKIDEQSYSDPDDILNALALGAKASGTNVDGNGSKYSQLVKYTVNTSGLITTIDTAVTSSTEDPTDETIIKPYEKNSSETMTYKSSEFTSTNKKFRIDSRTQVFLVPETRSDYETYGRKTSSFFKNDGTKYTIEAYDITGSLSTAGAVVVYATKEIEDVIDAETPLFIITSISQKTNPEGNACDVVRGYQISKTGAVTEPGKDIYTESVGVISGKYEIGDIIMYVTNNKGYLTVEDGKFKQVLDIDTFKAYDKVTSTSKTAEFYQGLLIGASIDGSKQIFVLSETDDIANCETAKQETFDITTKVFFSYDSSKEASKKVSYDESFDLTSLNSYNDTVESGIPKASKLFVYRYDGVARMVVEIK